MITQRKAYQDTHIVIEVGDTVFKDFLDAQTPKTRKTYECLLRKLIEYAHLSGQQLLDQQEQWNRKVLIFLQWLENQGYSDAYATTATSMVRGFFDFYHKPLVLNRSERKRLRERSRTTEDYLFDKEDIQKMATCGNLKEKYVVLCGTSFGLRSEDFSMPTYGTYRSLKLDSEIPIPLGTVETAKEKIKAYPFISSDALPIIKAILDGNKDAKDSGRVFLLFCERYFDC